MQLHLAALLTTRLRRHKARILLHSLLSFPLSLEERFLSLFKLPVTNLFVYFLYYLVADFIVFEHTDEVAQFDLQVLLVHLVL